MTKNSRNENHCRRLFPNVPWNGCYGQDKPIKKDLKFTAIPKNINNPYMVIQNGGAMDACKELGIEGKVVGPSETGASAQVPYINTAITQHQNAILISANDPNALVPYLKKAMSQKITIVTLDSDTAPGRSQRFHQPGLVRGHRPKSCSNVSQTDWEQR